MGLGTSRALPNGIDLTAELLEAVLDCLFQACRAGPQGTQRQHCGSIAASPSALEPTPSPCKQPDAGCFNPPPGDKCSKQEARPVGWGREPSAWTAAMSCRRLGLRHKSSNTQTARRSEAWPGLCHCSPVAPGLKGADKSPGHFVGLCKKQVQQRASKLGKQCALGPGHGRRRTVLVCLIGSNVHRQWLDKAPARWSGLFLPANSKA